MTAKQKPYGWVWEWPDGQVRFMPGVISPGEKWIPLYRTAHETAVWKPIETAPQGGRWVLLWWPYVTDAAFAGYCVKGAWYAATDSPDASWSVGPTHWMPLPAGPSEKASGLHDDVCATHKGYPCNCPSAALKTNEPYICPDCEGAPVDADGSICSTCDGAVLIQPTPPRTPANE